MQQAELLARAHRSGFYRLSQLQLKHLLADTSERHGPDMDPGVRGVCSQWIRRCKCVVGAASRSGERRSWSSSHRACARSCSSSHCPRWVLSPVSKYWRQAVTQTEELWVHMRAMAPWAAQAAECRPRNSSARLALRQETALRPLALCAPEYLPGAALAAGAAGAIRLRRASEVGRRRAACCFPSRLECRCLAALLSPSLRLAQLPSAPRTPRLRRTQHAEEEEVSCVDLLPDDHLVLTTHSPPTLQLWQLRTMRRVRLLNGPSSTREPRSNRTRQRRQRRHRRHRRH